MDQESLATASAMLRALITGASCERIAHEHRLTKSAISQRVRVLACTLQRIVGVVGVEEDVSPTASLIRENGEAYLEALEHFVPDAAPALRHARGAHIVDNLDLHLARIAQHSRSPRRDTALLLTLFSTAAKPLEIAQLEVRDYLDESGCVRSQSRVRPEIASNRIERPLAFQSAATIAAIDAYLIERIASMTSDQALAPYRGLDPQSRLFLSRDGKPMQIKRAGPAGQHLVCKEIHEIYRRIFAYGGLTGVNTACARRLAAQSLRGRGANPEEIGEALGLRKLAVYKLLRHGSQPMSRSP